ncbi:Dos2-interacting transcription regulator of RNA-Pol-II-domain-containing protein [Entophlyctis helioformis]|nr:Dos2-interacting transcription regulator of RNA-Pol-II-domain-containing protein [Entophlyctis helioformis]
MSLAAFVERALRPVAAAAAASLSSSPPPSLADSLPADSIGDIVLEINAARSTLLKLVECLGPALTDLDPFKRAQGVSLLASVIAKTDRSQISAQSATVLSQFFLSRLDDQPSVEYALLALLSLLESNALLKTDQISIPTRIFAELNVQTFQQSVRMTVFRIFGHLFDTNLEGLKRLGTDFVFGFIHVMDGEKDPRNLMLAFRLVRRIVAHLDFAKHAEDLFEVVFCYFPITFRPLPNDPYGITAEDLKGALRDAVASTPAFAGYAVPLLLEKLSSDSAAAKRDAMDAVAACAPVYGGQVFLPKLNLFWDALRKEMAQPMDPANELAAAKAIREITKALSTTVSMSSKRDTPLEAFITMILDDSIKSLEDVELKFAKPCGKIMLAAASASEPSCNMIVAKALPVVLNVMDKEDAPSKRKILVDIVGDFLVASRLVYGAPKSGGDEDLVGTPLQPFKDRLFELFMPICLSDGYVPLKLAALRGLTEMVLSWSLLSDAEDKVVLELVQMWLLSEPETQLHDKALETIQTLADSKTEAVLNITVPAILGGLQEARSDNNVDKVTAALLSCRALSRSKPMLPVIVGSLAQIVNAALAAQVLASRDVLLQILDSLLAILNDVAEPSAELKDQTPKLLLSLVDAAVTAHRSSGSSVDKTVVHQVAHNVAVLTRLVDVDTQSLLVEQLHATQGTSPEMWVRGVPVQPCLAYLYATVVANVSNKARLPIPGFAAFANDFVSAALGASGDMLLVEAAAKTIGSLVNKQHGLPGIDVFFSHFQAAVAEPVLFNVSSPAGHRLAVLTVYSWIAKALVLRASPLGYTMLTRVLGLLAETHGLSLAAAQAVQSIIADDAEGALTKSAHATIRMLFKQRVYNHCLPIVASGFRDAEDANKAAYLHALSHLLRNVPKGVLLNELPKLLPMLLFSLSLPEADLKLGTLQTIELMVTEAPSVVAEQISAIVPPLLSMSLYANRSFGNDPRVRVAALKVIGLLVSHVPYTVLHPYKPRVIRDLAPAADDPKRVVRREAAQTRNIWFMPAPTK